MIELKARYNGIRPVSANVFVNGVSLDEFRIGNFWAFSYSPIRFRKA